MVLENKYEFINDLTSDVAFHAYGGDLKELFSNCAFALLSVMCNIDSINKENSVRIKVEGSNLKELVFNWLQQLIAEVEIEEMYFSGFEIVEIDENHIVADCYGESIKSEKEGTLVKAVTNYLFDVQKEDGRYKATVSLDI